MLERIASKLTANLIKNKIIPAEDEEVYVYGWALLLSHLGSFATIFLIAFLTGEVLGTLVFVFAMLPLRSYAGGFHADTYLKCYLLSMTGYSAALLAALLWSPHHLEWTLGLLLFSLVVTLTCAPVDHPNKPLKEHQKQRNKKLSRAIASLQAALVLALWFLLPGTRHYLVWAMLGMATTSVTLLYVIVKPYKA
ncbi:MAG: accessory gene regulator B family protein [Oscillospiraceae bacterium]|nr:accessory gene regulator B family protein [Oscillospiraceae bacterium]